MNNVVVKSKQLPSSGWPSSYGARCKLVAQTAVDLLDGAMEVHSVQTDTSSVYDCWYKFRDFPNTYWNIHNSQYTVDFTIQINSTDVTSSGDSYVIDNPTKVTVASGKDWVSLCLTMRGRQESMVVATITDYFDPDKKIIVGNCTAQAIISLPGPIPLNMTLYTFINGNATAVSRRAIMPRAVSPGATGAAPLNYYVPNHFSGFIGGLEQFYYLQRNNSAVNTEDIEHTITVDNRTFIGGGYTSGTMVRTS